MPAIYSSIVPPADVSNMTTVVIDCALRRGLQKDCYELHVHTYLHSAVYRRFTLLMMNDEFFING